MVGSADRRQRIGPAEAEPRLRHAEGWIADQPNSPAWH
jgi:hypothetical protein